MWRFLHLLGWLIALGMAGWVSGLVAAIALDSVFEGRPYLIGPFVAASAGVGLIVGLWLSLASWSRGAWDRPLTFVGSVLVLLGLVTGAFFFVAGRMADYEDPDVPLAGIVQVLYGMLAFAGAAIGMGLALAGIAGRKAR